MNKEKERIFLLKKEQKEENYLHSHTHQFFSQTKQEEEQQEQELEEQEREEEEEVLSVDDVLNSLSLGLFHYLLFILCGLTFISASLEVMILSFLSICVAENWNLQSSETAFLSSISFLGVFCGNLVWGSFADKYGRRIALVISSLFVICFSLLTGFAPNYISLLFFRYFIGFGLSGVTVPFDVLAEYLPHEYRGVFLISVNYFWTLGSILQTLLAWMILPHYNWHILAIITAILVSIMLTITIILFPESPRWLLINGQIEEAKISIENAYKWNKSRIPKFKLKIINEIFYSNILNQKLHDFNDKNISNNSSNNNHHQKEILPSNIITNNTEHESYYKTFLHLFQGSQRQITISLWAIYFCYGCGYYGLVFLIPQIFQEHISHQVDSTKLTCQFQYENILIGCFFELFMIFICSILIQSLGRINLQSIFYGLSAISALLIGFPLISSSTSSPSEYATYLTIMTSFARSFALGSSCVTWVASPELFPTSLRLTGHSLAGCWAEFGEFLAPFLVNSSLNITSLSILFSLLNGIAAVIVVLFLPETKDIDIDSDIEREKSLDKLRSRYYYLNIHSPPHLGRYLTLHYKSNNT